MTEDGVIISVPQNAPGAISSTIVMEIKGAPEIAATAISQKRDGSISLPAADADLHGQTFQYESGGPLDDIGYWTNPGDWADWQFKVKEPGKFIVSAIVAAPATSPFEISIAGQTIHCAAPVTGNYITFQTVKLGEVEIKSAGPISLAVRPVKNGWQPINLKSITLTKVVSEILTTSSSL